MAKNEIPAALPWDQPRPKRRTDRSEKGFLTSWGGGLTPFEVPLKKSWSMTRPIILGNGQRIFYSGHRDSRWV